MGLNPRLITNTSLEQILVDKDTGLPLSGGYIYFYADDNRTQPKLVYQLSGSPPNYTYTPLPNPVPISSVGTPMDAAGNNISIYYFPYNNPDPNGTQNPTDPVQLYYVVVQNSLGVAQFTRQGWPNYTAVDQPVSEQVTYDNLLSNPQFSSVSFTGGSLNISFSIAGTYSYNIAPGWVLQIQSSGAGTASVTQTPVVGSAQYPTNPPYTLDFVAGANITSMQLIQQLSNNPNIWSPANGGTNGYLATSIVVSSGTTLNINYTPSVGTSTQLLSANNASGSYEQFTSTIQLPAANNTQNGNTGYVNIVINLPTSGNSSITSVQIVGLESNVIGVPFDQEPVNRQIDHLFHYYNSQLQYKPIRSSLIGWDFPLNPAQFLGYTVAASGAGANTSAYIWDQTILFQNTNNGAAASQSASGSKALTITATNATQFALVQYLTQTFARKILNTRNCVNVSALTSVGAGVVGTVSLWYTKSASLPSISSNNSLVATLDANGHPATLNGTWFEVQRPGLANQKAQFTVGTSTTTNFNSYGFSGWDMQGVADCNAATFFAIVVGFATLPQGQTIDFNSISLIPGDIPTIPAVQHGAEVLLECQKYYWKSFLPTTVPAQNIGVNNGELNSVASVSGAGACLGPSVKFPVPMVNTPTVTLYSPGDASANIYNVTTSQAFSGTTKNNITINGFNTQGTGSAGTTYGNVLGVHATADARLGTF